jgi:hypothetical protein
VTEPTGRLSITLSHPAAAFLYQATTPRVHIDGADAKVQGWGAHTIPVGAGAHWVDVWVPYALPRRAGRARAEISVGPGEEARLEYMAPTLTFARGSLGAPGQQRSTGFRLVMALNIIAVLALVIGFVIVITR